MLFVNYQLFTSHGFAAKLRPVLDAALIPLAAGRHSILWIVNGLSHFMDPQLLAEALNRSSGTATSTSTGMSTSVSTSMTLHDLSFAGTTRSVDFAAPFSDEPLSGEPITTSIYRRSIVTNPHLAAHFPLPTHLAPSIHPPPPVTVIVASQVVAFKVVSLLLYRLRAYHASLAAIRRQGQGPGQGQSPSGEVESDLTDEQLNDIAATFVSGCHQHPATTRPSAPSAPPSR